MECHGQINQMETVYQAKPMNMAWCLQCHRDPTDRIRPRDEITKLDWKPGAEDASTVAAFAGLPYDALYAAAFNAGVDIKNPQMSSPRTDIGANELAKKYVVRIVKNESESGLRTELGKVLKDQYHVNPNTDCITCHR